MFHWKITKEFLQKRWVQNTITGCLIALFYFYVSHFSIILKGLSNVWDFVSPVFWAWVIAYILDPFVKVFENRVFKKLKHPGWIRGLSVVCTLVILILLMVLLGFTLFPQLGSSIAYLVGHLDSYAKSFDRMVQSLTESLSWLPFQVSTPLMLISADRVIQGIADYVKDNAGQIINTSYSIGANLINALISFVLAFYLLTDKRRIMDAIRRFFRALLKEHRFQSMSVYLRHCHAILIRYIAFDILEGIIVGLVNCIFMAVMGMPYAVLISVVVGITNLAPTFGPIAGALIGGFILVLVNPWQALYFLIFTLILQTVDGYILKPKLFGDSLGVPSVLILVSIIVGSKMFGVTGILLAIPFAAILDFTYRDIILKRLEE
ncbi:MAG: AI-2E family transporter [Lachnospiraceae bacterium]|nr:AI-2E family transporter [Lachnospiraceae bacterium]